MAIIQQIYTLSKTILETGSVKTLYLTPDNGAVPEFIPGQFISVFFLSHHDIPFSEERQYTISSLLSDINLLSITVEKVGLFSGALFDLEIGQKLLVSAPFGFFYPTQKMQNIIFIAGGIGVVPFYAFLKNFHHNPYADKNIHLLYSNKKCASIPFIKELNLLSNIHTRLNISYHVTQEMKHGTSKNTIFERINESHIKNISFATDLNTYYFICGSFKFVTDMTQVIRKIGIRDEQIYTELFY